MLSRSTQDPPTPTRSPNKVMDRESPSKASRTNLPVSSSPTDFLAEVGARRFIAVAACRSICRSEAAGSLHARRRSRIIVDGKVGIKYPVFDSHSSRKSATKLSLPISLPSPPQYKIFAPTDIAPHSTWSFSQEGRYESPPPAQPFEALTQRRGIFVRRKASRQPIGRRRLIDQMGSMSQKQQLKHPGEDDRGHP